MPPPTFQPITDPGDPRVADFRRLNDASYRRSVEHPGPFARGTFVAEGWTVCERLLTSRYPLRSILAVDTKTERLAELVGSRPVTCFTAPRDVVDAVVGFPLHRGIVASADRGMGALPEHVGGRARRLLMIDGVNDAENMGALFRNAAAFDIDGVLLDPTSQDPLGRRVVRVSMGHVLSIPWARGNTADELGRADRAGVETIALTPAGEHRLDDLPTDAARTAVLVGSEGPGLDRETIAACRWRLRIPMRSDVDSLNVAVAASIALHHLGRDRLE